MAVRTAEAYFVFDVDPRSGIQRSQADSLVETKYVIEERAGQRRSRLEIRFPAAVDHSSRTLGLADAITDEALPLLDRVGTPATTAGIDVHVLDEQAEVEVSPSLRGVFNVHAPDGEPNIRFDKVDPRPKERAALSAAEREDAIRAAKQVAQPFEAQSFVDALTVAANRKVFALHELFRSGIVARIDRAMRHSTSATTAVASYGR